MPASVDSGVRRRLVALLIVYEIAIIAVIVGAGANIALTQGGTLIGAAPLIAIGLAESLRVPLAGWSTRLRLRGKLLAWLALAAIALTSFDGLALVFENFLDNRMVNVLAAQHRVEIAQAMADQGASDVAAFTAEVGALDAQVAALAKSMPSPPAASDKVCTGKRHARVTCNADAAAAATYQSAMKSYDARLSELTSKRSGLQAKVDGARAGKGAAETLADARRNLDDELQLSAMHRLAGSIFGERVSAVSEDEFNRLKRFAVVGLAGSFALMSMIVSLVVHLQSKGAGGGKLNRAIRAWIARRRRPLTVYRDVLGPVRTEVRERTRIVYLPIDEQGRVLNPDAKLRS
jgi:hypothetical protein